MVAVCFYFQVHQPYRLRKYPVFDIGANSDYFNHEKNREIMLKVADKCYLPANRVILDLINEMGEEFRVSYSITGVALEQFREYCPEVLESFQRLTDTGQVELLDETYYHSLSFLYSEREFIEQVKMHRKAMQFATNRNLDKKEDIRKSNISVLKTKGIESVEGMVERLKNDERVEYV
ncbi:MAG: alpha-amylase, partial [Candidatus Altiarchaeota archaeon]|nr:alpha-amylase [Candidatus Altiarchaeota archaeon]